MSEEMNLSPTPEEQLPQEQVKQEDIPVQEAPPAPKKGGKKQQQSVTRYLAVLFAAAFLLMGMSYMMEKRQYDQQVNNLEEHVDDLTQQSVSAMQSVKQLIQENEEMKTQIKALEEDLIQIQKERNNLSNLLISREQTLTLTQLAMDYFWQLNEAFVRGKYTTARDLIQIMEGEPAAVMEGAPYGSPIKDYLPSASVTNTDRFSPADRYVEIYDKLF